MDSLREELREKDVLILSMNEQLKILSVSFKILSLPNKKNMHTQFFVGHLKIFEHTKELPILYKKESFLSSFSLLPLSSSAG